MRYRCGVQATTVSSEVVGWVQSILELLLQRVEFGKHLFGVSMSDLHTKYEYKLLRTSMIGILFKAGTEHMRFHVVTASSTALAPWGVLLGIESKGNVNRITWASSK